MRPATRLLPSLLALVVALPLLVGAAPDPAADPGTEGVDAALDVAADVTGVAEAADAVVTAVHDELTTTGCRSPFELDPLLGCARTRSDGMVEYVTPDGTVGSTFGSDGDHGHGASQEPEDGDDHEQVTAASASSRALPSTRRKLVCAPEGEARTVVLYGHRPGADRRSHHLGTIRTTMERSNQAVAVSARQSGGPLADLRVRCSSDGAVAVTPVALRSNKFADVRASVAAAGYDQPHEKYLVFGDIASPEANVSGRADLYLDDRRSVNNRNNGSAPMYAVVYGASYFDSAVPLHELGHTMGAVQPGAPKADKYGHCTDQLDVLCYPSSSSRCGAIAFDCGNDTFFSTATRSGEWLHTHWNLGWEGNRFIRLATASSSSSSGATVRGPGGFTDTAGHPHAEAIATAVERKIATGYQDGTFRPGQAVTRGQMATFLTRALSLPAGDASGFSDVRGHAHAAGIGAVVRAGITEGYRDRTFRPDAAVTRAQMASFLARALALPAASGHGFSDVGGSTHEGAIAGVAEADITKGYRDGTFRPNQPVQRGQMATFLVRALDQR